MVTNVCSDCRNPILYGISRVDSYCEDAVTEEGRERCEYRREPWKPKVGVAETAVSIPARRLPVLK
uniref:Uncharacterized protein n=1 Tax=viral metagenome TaxID=1070528 RepID=A0A6M3L3R5_9ZZZZ